MTYDECLSKKCSRQCRGSLRKVGKECREMASVYDSRGRGLKARAVPVRSGSLIKKKKS